MKKLAVSLLAAVALSACGTLGLVQKDDPPATKVYGARVTYGVALLVVAKYEAKPRCGMTTDPICSDPKVVTVLRQAQLSADTALDAAENIVLTPGFGDEVYSSIAIAAVNAAVAFDTIANQYK